MQFFFFLWYILKYMSPSLSLNLRLLMAAAPEMMFLLRFSAETIRYESWRPNSQVSPTQYSEAHVNTTREKDWKEEKDTKGQCDGFTKRQWKSMKKGKTRDRLLRVHPFHLPLLRAESISVCIWTPLNHLYLLPQWKCIKHMTFDRFATKQARNECKWLHCNSLEKSA